MKTITSKYIFWLGLFLALLVIGATFAVNLVGSVYGGQASLWQFAMTMFYTVFWCAFSWLSVKYVSLRKIVLAISLLTLISSAITFICVITNRGFVIEAILSVFATIPFYGVRYFISWDGLYGCTFVVSLVWFIFAVIQLRKSIK